MRNKKEETAVYEKLINNTEELNAMAVHLRISQNFSELQALAAQWMVPALLPLNTAVAEVGAMSLTLG